MGGKYSYPGVYIEEVPSGVKTINGVPTSITAFIGRAKGGPINEPQTIHNYSDFERIFGGLWDDSQMSYSVKDFFLNGGRQAIIVRLFKRPSEGDGIAKLTFDNLKLEAANPDECGNLLKIKVDFNDINEDDKFNLSVEDSSTSGLSEKFTNLTVVDGPRRVDQFLKIKSKLLRVQLKEDGTTDLPDRVPAEGEEVLEGGIDSDLLKAVDFIGKRSDKSGLYALEKADLFNLLCIPPDTREGDTPKEVYKEAMDYCKERRAMLIVDPPRAWKTKDDAKNGLSALSLSGINSINAAIFFPRVIKEDPLQEGQSDTFVPCGVIAGVFARTDAQRGVWKAPAGLDATLNGVKKLSVPITDAENGELNPIGINCLRSMPPVGLLVWGSRTLSGDDRQASEWKYIPIRRVALFIEESLYRGTQWVVFEPNDEPLWAQIRLNVGTFMHNLFRQGAFQGSQPRDAYFVKCDSETTTQTDRDHGIVNILVGFAPLKPAEFVVIKISQIAGKLRE